MIRQVWQKRIWTAIPARASMPRSTLESSDVRGPCRDRLADKSGAPHLALAFRTKLHVRAASSELSQQNDTIYALSSASGKAGIAVIRISGSNCHDVHRGLCPGKRLPNPRHATVRTLLEPSGGRNAGVLDLNAIVLFFPGPKTVTGEDVLELHIHGGSATVKAVLAAVSRCAEDRAIRYAEPGEFTRRAFLHGRLDLAQVESLSDTLAAETEQQRRAAVQGNSGALGKTYEAWRAKLVLARGEMEALIDFSEDHDFDESAAQLLGNVTAMVKTMLESIRLHEMGGQRSELLRKGISIALVGPPNVGKSSLMNQIVGREASIVSDEAGTTRDIVEAKLDIHGYLCSFADTAGIRTKPAVSHGSADAKQFLIGTVEQEGIQRARKKASESDVILVLGSVEPARRGGFRIHYDLETLHLATRSHQCLVVINKCDMVDEDELKRLVVGFKSSVLGQIRGMEVAEPLAVSCKDHPSASGPKSAALIQGLVSRLAESFSALTSLPSHLQDLLGVTERQGQLLGQCRAHLEDLMDESNATGSGHEPDVVLAAEHLRLAADCLARITGRVQGSDVEEVLGVIFEKFCVGK